MSKYLTSIIATISLSVLTGCASIVSGTNQSVSIHTGSVGGATCALENDKGKWFINSTPGSVTVNRSYNDLRINCDKPRYKHSYKQVASKTKAMAFGNVLFGGLIGAGVDIMDGAAYDYPTEIYIPMQRA